MKTGHQVETDIFNLLKGSALMGHLNGKLYRNGTRPRGSKAEDLVVIFTTADGEQVQSGVVTLNIYVPDLILNRTNGVPMEDIARCEQIEGLLQAEIEGWKTYVSDYKFKLKNAIHTRRDETLQQSFVVARLSFSIF